MRRNSRASFTVAAVLLAAVAANAGLVAEMTPARVPDAVPQDLPDGLGKALVVSLCSGCHDLMFTMTTRETEEGWTRIINDMRSRGTDGTEAQFEQVVTYLAAHMGKPEPPAGHAALELVANRTKVVPGERFAVGLRLVPADGWRLKDGAVSDRSPKVSWAGPQTISIGDPVLPAAAAPAMLVVFPAEVSQSVVLGSVLDLTARVAYEVCRTTCVIATVTASLSLPVGDGGMPSFEKEFAQAGGGIVD